MLPMLLCKGEGMSVEQKLCFLPEHHQWKQSALSQMKYILGIGNTEMVM